MSKIGTAVLSIMAAIAIAGSAVPTRASLNDAPIDSLMGVLDNVMERRQYYLQIKEERLARLRDAVDTTHTADQRFAALGRLYDEYLSYAADSAIAIAAEREAVGLSNNSHEQYINGRLNTANVLSMTGSYTEALDIMRDITLLDLPDYLYPYYFHIKRTTYGNMADYAVRESDRRHYRYLTACYRDSLLTVNDRTTSTWSLIKGDMYNATGQSEQAIATLNTYISNHPMSEHEEAIFAYTLAEAYRLTGDEANYKRYLLISAIDDLRSGVREYVSPRQLAVLLYNEGDLERAYHLLRLCLDDATSSGSRLRIFEINETFPLINEMYISTIRDQQRRQRNMLWLIALLVVFLAAALFWVYKQMRHARRISAQVADANTNLRRLNEQLHEANADIAEHSRIRTEYIGRYMEQCLHNIDALAAYRKQLRKLLAAGNIDRVARTLESDAVLDDAFDNFYNDFDSTFLKLFPTFVQDFNNLLNPDERIYPKHEGTLNTELRIYALIRLGITDSAKIAKFLRYSVTTIYNYRTKVRNRAAGDRALLEEEVAKIGR